MKIVTLTVNSAIDKSTNSPQVVPDSKLKCADPVYEPGGGGINVARALKRIGIDALAIVQHGGPMGRLLLKLLDEENVNHLGFETEKWTRENFIVVDKSTSRQYRFGMPGPWLTENEWEKSLDLLDNLPFQPDFIVASGSLPPGVPDDYYLRVSYIAKSKNAKLVLDTSGKELIEAVKGEIFMIKPNLSELSSLAGKDFIEGIEQETLAKQLIDKGNIEKIVVSLGARGAMLVSSNGVQYITPPTVITKSTVGAGDCMVAGMVYALTKNFSESDVLKFGIACGTAATMCPGTELFKEEDVKMIFNWLKEKK